MTTWTRSTAAVGKDQVFKVHKDDFQKKELPYKHKIKHKPFDPIRREDTSSSEDDYDEIKSKITDEAKKMFKPEFLNRLDDLVIFRKLTKDHIKEIAELEIQKLRDRVRSKGFKIRVSSKVKDFIIEKGYDEKFGARPLRRAVEKHLEDTLAEAILEEEIRCSKSICKTSFNLS